jgi:hypothetical protein
LEAGVGRRRGAFLSEGCANKIRANHGASRSSQQMGSDAESKVGEVNAGEREEVMQLKTALNNYEPITESGCWIWSGILYSTGYGCLWIEGKSKLAHRVFYESLVEKIPTGLQLDHLCRVRCCVNPAHLEAVTGKENRRRGISPVGVNYRKTHCLRGHELSGHNIVIYNGMRHCKQCNSIRSKKSIKLKKLKLALKQGEALG